MLADLRNRLFSHLQRLSLGFYERNRAGVIISRLTNDVEALDQLVTDGVTSLVQNTLTLVGTAIVLFFLDWRLALASLTVMPADDDRDGLVPEALRPRLPRRARDARSGHRDARRGHRRHAGAAVVHARAGRAARTSARSATPTGARTCRPSCSRASTSRSSTSSRRRRPPSCSATAAGSCCTGASRSAMLVAFLGYLTNFFDPVQQLSQLYNTFLSAVAALDKITDLLDEEPEVLDAADAATDSAQIRGARPLRRRPLHLRARRRGAARRLDSTIPPARPSRSSGTRARASRRSRSCSRASTTRPRCDHDRRHRPAARHAGVAAQTARDRSAGGLPVRGDGGREHRVRTA